MLKGIPGLITVLAILLLVGGIAILRLTSSTSAGNNLYLPLTQIPEDTLYNNDDHRPVSIESPKLNHEVIVAAGSYDNQNHTWTLNKDTAHYAIMTPAPNLHSGQTFLYGHNNPQVFGKLKELSRGDEVQIKTASNRIFRYSFESSEAVTPDDTEILRYEGEARLVIQTCSGWWNEKRQIYIFKLEGVN